MNPFDSAWPRLNSVVPVQTVTNPSSTRVGQSMPDRGQDAVHRTKLVSPDTEFRALGTHIPGLLPLDFLRVAVETARRAADGARIAEAGEILADRTYAARAYESGRDS